MPGSATYDYRCTIRRVIDGDTLDVSIDLGFGIQRQDRVRAYGLNCREIHSRDAKEKRAGLVDKEFATALLPAGTEVTIRSHKPANPEEKYGRWLATITLPDGRDFAESMIAAGCGVPYFGGDR